MTSRFVTEKRVLKKMWHNASLSSNVAFVRNDPHATSTAGWRLMHASLRHPAGNIPLQEGEPCITMHKRVFFAHRHFFSLPAAGIFSCSRPRSTQVARPNTTAKVWALAEVRGTCSEGSKSQVTTGRHSEHVEPPRPIQTHKQVKKNVRRLM